MQMRESLPLITQTLGNKLWKLSVIPQKSVAGFFADFRGLTRTTKSPPECRGLSRTVLVRESPRSDFSEKGF